MDLSVVIVNYDTSGYLRASVASVLDDAQGLSAECIVVDNHSPDGSAKMIAQEFPQVVLIANAINVGFSTGVNQGIAVAKGRYFLVLNADTVVLPGALSRLIGFMDAHPDCGIAGPRLEWPDGRLQPSCRTFYTLETLLLRRTLLGRLAPKHPALRQHLMLDWDHSTEREVDWLLGAAMMVRRKAVEQVGGMDERYFLYLEDVDWCFRMHQRGWTVRYCPQARIIHHYRQGSQSGFFNPDLWIHLESAVRFYDKWGKLAYLAKRYLSSLHRPVFLCLDFLLMLWALWGWTDWPWSVAPVAIQLLTSMTMGFYRLRGNEGIAELIWLAMRVVGVAILASGLFFWATRVPVPHIFRSRKALVTAYPSAVLALASTRWLLLAARKWFTSRRLSRTRCVIIGTDETARQLAEALEADPALGYDVAGFVGTDPAAAPLLGSVEELPGLARRASAQEVIFVQGSGGLEPLMAPIVACRKVPLDVKVVLTAPESSLFTTGLIDLADYPAVDLPGTPLDHISRALKRATDVVVSLVALVLLGPLMAAIAAAIKLTEGGPVLIARTHIGADEKPFQLLRFRTGRDGAPPEEPPRSRLALFLRHHKLDKLPELINVLKGEMSLVGPRPPLPGEVASYRDWHHSRFAERPGITGLWQVEKARKWRFDQMVRLDLHYVLHRSLALDAQILLKTLAAVLSEPVTPSTSE